MMATAATRDDRGIWKKALITVPLIVIVGGLMGVVSNSGVGNDWYAPLAKPSFFGGGMIDVALLVMLAMNVFVTATIISLWKVRPLAGALLIPYLLWLCLATALNHETGRLNPGADRTPLGLIGD